MDDITPWLTFTIRVIVLPLIILVWTDMRRRVSRMEASIERMSEQFVPRRELDVIHASGTERLAKITDDLHELVDRLSKNGLEGRIRNVEQRLVILEARE